MREVTLCTMPTRPKKQSVVQPSPVQKSSIKRPPSKRFSFRRLSKKRFTFSLVPLIVATIVVLGIGALIGKLCSQNESLLFVQQAVGGTFSLAEGSSDTYVLRLVGVKPHTLLLGDTPSRKVGSWTNSDFVTRWSGTESEPVRAVLLSHNAADGKEYAIAVSLKSPTLNAFAGTLEYEATVLNDMDKGHIVPSDDRHMEAFPNVLRSPALFIEE